MSILKATSSKGNVKRIIQYVLNEEKTLSLYVNTLNCMPESSTEEMLLTKELYRKKDGRQYYHFIHSFPPDEAHLTPTLANTIATALAEKSFKGFEVLIATHVDRKHIHNHIIVNSVSLETGLKLHLSKYDLQKIKDINDQLCLANNLSICEKGKAITSYCLSKYKQLEKADAGKERSYLMDCASAVMNALKTAATREEFMNLMLHGGYETLWKDTRKAITFTCPNGKKVRNTNLEKTFKLPVGKEAMEHAIQTNAEQRQWLASAFTIERADGTGQTDHRASSIGNSRAEAGETAADFDEFKAELEDLRAGSAHTRAALAAGQRREADRRTEATSLERAWYGGEDRERAEGTDECYQESGISRDFSR